MIAWWKALALVSGVRATGDFHYLNVHEFDE